MPMNIGRDTLISQASTPAERTRLIKRSTVLLFILIALAIAADRLGLTTKTLAALGVEQSQEQRQLQSSSVTGSDCGYLKAPQNFSGVQARHRTAVSEVTEAFSHRLGKREDVSLLSADAVPRRNVIDNILFGKMDAKGVQSAPLSTDEEFLRRIYLDLTGRIPAADVVTEFLNSKDLKKRDAVADRLINSPEFVDKWTLFYGDLFKNSSSASNVRRYTAGREAFYNFIKDSIANNKSYAQMASEMITAKGDSFVTGATNFIVGGRVPMGPRQDTFDGQAAATATTFLGLSSMDCLLCHDGAGHLDAVNLWGSKATRAEAWGMSAFFARTLDTSPTAFSPYTVTDYTRGEYGLDTDYGNRQARRPLNGKNTVDPKYLFGGGGVNAGEERRQALARHLTADPQFARAAVNYIWEELMVEALVSPSNAFDPARLDPNVQLPNGWTLQPANAELLQTLADEFRNNGFSLRNLVGLIVKSSAYQLSSSYPGQWRVEYVPLYARKFIRRLKAEELHDSLIMATNLPTTTTYREGSVGKTIIGFPLISDDTNKKVREVKWAVQLPEPLEPRQNNEARAFLDSFLRGNRDFTLRSDSGSILQALNLMNSPFVFDRTRSDQIDDIPNTPAIPSTVRRLVTDTKLSNEQIITQLYLSTLSRLPSQAEMDKLVPHFASMSKAAATETVQWVLLNKVDFLFNY
jgi:hypothetical protein